MVARYSTSGKNIFYVRFVFVVTGDLGVNPIIPVLEKTLARWSRI